MDYDRGHHKRLAVAKADDVGNSWREVYANMGVDTRVHQRDPTPRRDRREEQ